MRAYYLEIVNPGPEPATILRPVSSHSVRSADFHVDTCFTFRNDRCDVQVAP